MKKLVLCLLCVLICAGCSVSKQKKAMDQAVEKANVVLKKKEKPYNPQTKTALQQALKKSEKADEDQEYAKAADEIKKDTKAYSDSIRQLKQITQPKQSFLLERVKEVPTITKVEAATEKTDDNKLMNKKGGYYAYIAMKSSMVKNEYYKTQSPVEAGNSGGAVIEAFKTVKDAKKRNDYLSLLDGAGVLAPGGHKIAGTLVIRTSNELTATQQRKLTDDIIHALVKIS